MEELTNQGVIKWLGKEPIRSVSLSDGSPLYEEGGIIGMAVEEGVKLRIEANDL